MKNMKKQLIELLNIHATSGNERPVRRYLQNALEGLVDKMHIDHYGNLLAEKKVGSGEGATILLSAHMDTVKAVVANRKLIEKSGIISSSKGALGADDRAGIAIILAVLKDIENISSFNGIIKVAFSREEEIGCIGASKISKKWYKDVDLAIVIDRRGNRDVVVGCGMAFCSDAVGEFFQDVSKMSDMNWSCVEGGISDTMVFAEGGINSVNLSAGYYGEHTDKEFVMLTDMRDTLKLIMQTFAVVNQFYQSFGKVPTNNKWVKAWYPNNKTQYNKDEFGIDGGYGGYSGYDNFYYDDEVLMEKSDINGDVTVYEFAGQIIITQGKDEIIMTRESFKEIMSQIGKTSIYSDDKTVK